MPNNKKQVANSINYDYKTDLRNGSEIIANHKHFSDKLNYFFVESVDDLLNRNNNCINVHTSQQRINYCPNTIFLYPVSDNNVKSIT